MSDKVIIASFGKTRTARTATQFQYNHGQKLQFENVDLPANYEVHFSNSVNGEAKTRMGDSTGVVIPPEYFVPGTTIYAWIYVADEDSGITIRKVEIPISVKAKPTDQPLEPEDESLVEQVVNRLNETIDEIPNKIDQALEEAKESGEFNGPKGDPFTYDDFTPEQLESLKGPKGDSFTYDDFTPEQLEGLKGPKGDSFTYDDFTPEELEELTGPQGPEGSTIWTTNTPYSYSQETGRYYFAASNLSGPTTATKKLYDLVYLSDDINKEYKAFYIVEFQYGGLQVGCRYLADMQGPPGEGVTGAVLYNKAQALSESEKNRARQNIGAASISDLGVVFRLKGEVNNVSDLPSTGNRAGDVYFVRSKSVGYVWLETFVRPDGYWEELGEPIDISNLPDTITWFAGTVDADDHFTPDEYLTIQNIVMAISNNRLPIIAASFSDGTIIKLPLLRYSFTNSISDYFVFYTITSAPSKALQVINPLSEFYRVSYYKKLTTGGTPVWRRKYDHGYFVEPETIGDLSDLNTTDKSSIVNAINELAESGSSDVAVFDFVISLENDEYVITQNPEYDDVYTAFEDGKIVIAKIRRINDSIWTDYCFIGTLEEAHDSTGGSVIYFSGETGPGNYFIIRGRKSGSVINDWEVVIDNSIWSAVDELESGISEKYTKPSGGIPKTDLASAVQTSLGKADAAYQKPSGGIPKTDLASDVQNSLSVVIDFEYVGLDSDGTTQILSTNVTPSEIHSFYQAGRVVMARYTDENLVMPLCTTGENTDMVMFSAEFNGSEEMIWSEDLTDNTVWYYGSTYMIPPLLRPGHADDGKIQVANNGMWTAAQPTIPMGHLDSTSTATVMTATIPGITELRDGVCVWLENGVITSAENFTININGLGAKPCYSSLAAATRVTTAFSVNYTMLMVYNSTRVDGGCWDIVYGYDTNTTYTPPKLGFGYGTCTTAAATAAKTASISSYTLVTGGIVAIKFENDVPAGASLNINSKGAKAIYYKGAAITAGVIKAGDTVTMIYSTYYHVLSIDRDIPAPSDTVAEDVTSNFSSSGFSKEYARADHVHRLDVSVFKTILDEVPAVNMPVILYDGNNNGVVIQKSPQTLMNIYQHQPKLNLALIVPPNYNNYPVIFTASSLNTTTGELHLTGITGGVLYEATLLPGLDPIDNDGIAMVGTMTTTNLALPSAQGVSF